MANRPVLPSLWALEALPEDIGDADVYVPSNPEYPEQQPNQYTVGWSVPPKVDVKQPHQWINSWYYSVDWILTSQRSGDLGWDSSVNYATRATILHNGKRWTAQADNINQEPSDTSLVWLEAEFGMKSAADVQLKLQQITAAIDTHFNDVSDPHQVDWSKFYNGVGASVAQIDAMIQAAAESITSHSGNRSNPHELTCAQVNVLAAAVGGSFLGEVSMLRMLKANGEAIRRNGPCFEMAVGSSSLGLAGSNACKDGQDLVSFGNYQLLKAENNWRFPVPTPVIHLPLVSGINVYAASGTGIEYQSTGEIEYTNKSGIVETAAAGVPAFGAQGLELRAGKGQSLVLTGAYTGTQGTVSGTLDGAVLLADILLDKTNVLEYFPQGTAIRDIRIWNQPLTAYQKAALGFH